jgi:hypothetical protein
MTYSTDYVRTLYVANTAFAIPGSPRLPADLQVTLASRLGDIRVLLDPQG